MQDLRLRPWTAKDEEELRNLQQRKEGVHDKLDAKVSAAMSGIINNHSRPSRGELISYMIANAKDIRDALQLADDGERPPKASE